MKRKVYVGPETEITTLESNDIITTSGFEAPKREQKAKREENKEDK